MAGVHASLHIMVASTERMRMRVRHERGCTFAALDADDAHLTLSGPPERIAATLRKLADKVDGAPREDEEEVGR